MRWIAVFAVAYGLFLGCSTTQRVRASRLPKRVVIETDMGNIEVELFVEEAPKTCANFVRLVKQHYYNNLPFFRVVKGMLVETGCPRGDGSGGPGWTVPLEITSHKHVPGAVVMERKIAQEGSHGSQFYICCGRLPERDGKFCVFGRVISGMDVVRKIENVDVDVYFIGGEPFHRPKNPPKVLRIRVVEEKDR